MTYRYKIAYYDGDATRLYAVGFVQDVCYSDAVKQITTHYGEQNVESILEVTLVGDTKVVELGFGEEEDSESILDAARLMDKYQKSFVW